MFRHEFWQGFFTALLNFTWHLLWHVIYLRSNTKEGGLTLFIMSPQFPSVNIVWRTSLTNHYTKWRDLGCRSSGPNWLLLRFYLTARCREKVRNVGLCHRNTVTGERERERDDVSETGNTLRSRIVGRLGQQARKTVGKPVIQNDKEWYTIFLTPIYKKDIDKDTDLYH